jgi:excisionase family DNA binding protein
MATSYKKVHIISDQITEHHEGIWTWKKEISTPYLFDEIWDAMQPARYVRTKFHAFSLFDKNNLTKIVCEIKYHERLILFLRPEYKLDHIIVEPENVVVDVHFTKGGRLLYSFFNPTKKKDIITITAKLGEDLTGVYRKIAAHPDDLQLRQYFIKQAIEVVSFDSEPRVLLPELMTIEQVAEFLQMEVKTIRNWVAEKRIPFKKVGSAVRFNKKEIDSALDAGTLGKKNPIKRKAKSR